MLPVENNRGNVISGNAVIYIAYRMWSYLNFKIQMVFFIIDIYLKYKTF